MLTFINKLELLNDNVLSLWKKLKDKDSEGIALLYHKAYHVVISHLIEKGFSEEISRIQFKNAVVFLLNRIEVDEFNPKTDVVLYLTALTKSLLHNELSLSG